MRGLVEVYLPLEGVEALSLIELEGLKQQDAAERMGVSRQTFGRVLSQARKAVAEAVVNGQALRIGGGDYAVRGSSRVSTSKNKREPEMSKIAVSSEGPGLDDRVDPRFGRAAGFVVVESETMEHQYIDNGSSQVMGQGAGIQAAENILRAGAGVILTGYVGPKAFRALEAAGIDIIQDLEGLSVAEAVAKFKAGQLTLAGSPNRKARGRR
jgi:predicted DNA-binding protein (UPF0251 family)/predicted Fe-Mo cluster-binding NifX family protein